MLSAGKGIYLQCEAVLPAAGEAFWLQRLLEKTTLGLQVLGETIVGLWRLDVDGAVYSSQNGLGSLSFLPVLLGTLMRQLPMKTGGGIFDPSWQKEQHMSSGGKAEYSTLFKQGKEKCKLKQPITQGDLEK